MVSFSTFSNDTKFTKIGLLVKIWQQNQKKSAPFFIIIQYFNYTVTLYLHASKNKRKNSIAFHISSLSFTFFSHFFKLFFNFTGTWSFLTICHYASVIINFLANNKNLFLYKFIQKNTSSVENTSARLATKYKTA